MKRTLSIFLSITVLLSVFLMPTIASAQGDKVDTKNAISVNASSTKYETTINNVDEENRYKTFKITAETTGIYKFYTTYHHHIATDASLYKPDNLSKDSYIINRRVSSFYSTTPFPIYYLLKKGETVYIEISTSCVISSDTDYKYTFYAEKESDCSYKNGVIYKFEESTKNYYVLNNYLSKKQSVTIESKIKGYPVTYIERNAFFNCKFITSVTIPSSVKELRINAFCDCIYLNSVKLSNGLNKICEGAFYNTNIRTLTLPDTLQDISYLIKIPFLKNIYTSKNNPYYTSKNGVLFSKDMKSLCLYPTAHGMVYTVPNGVETIDKYAFMVSTIEKITLPKSLKTIKDSAFASCHYLKTINFNEGLISIEREAFEFCNQLCHIELPSTLKTIYYSAFRSCDLRFVEIPKNVTDLYNYIFENNIMLESILIKGKTTNISDSLFFKNTKTTIYAPSNSTAEKYATENNHNFVSTDLSNGSTCKNHKYVINKCLKQPDCMNYGVFSTKCAICSKAGPNKKVNSLDHAYNNQVCVYCNTPTNQTITAEYNKNIKCAIPIASSYSTEKYITFIAPKDGKYSFNFTNPNCKFKFEFDIKIFNTYTIEHNTKYVSKNYKQTLNLNKNNIVRITVNEIDDYTYYEPIKFNFKVSCGHSYKNTVVKPTYFSNGYTLHKCTNCNHSYKDKTTKKLTLPTPSGVTVKAQKKAFTVSYKKVAKAKGYQIQYSTSNKFKSAKTVKITKNTTLKKTISKLSSKKKYYIRVRSYVVQNKKTAYSNWSKTKNVKTK